MSEQITILAFLLGGPEMLLIGGAAVLLIFGGKRIPDLARSVGRSIVEFKAGMKDVASGDTEKPPESKPPESPQSDEQEKSQ